MDHRERESRRDGGRAGSVAALRAASSARRPYAAGSNAEGCGRPGACRQSFRTGKAEGHTKGHATLVWNNLRHVVDRNDQKRYALFAGADDKIKDATLTAKLLDQPEGALRRLDPETRALRQAGGRKELFRLALPALIPHPGFLPTWANGATVEAAGWLSPKPIQAAAPPPKTLRPAWACRCPRSPTPGLGTSSVRPDHKSVKALFSEIADPFSTCRTRQMTGPATTDPHPLDSDSAAAHVPAESCDLGKGARSDRQRAFRAGEFRGG
jgi:hypothetical protein